MPESPRPRRRMPPSIPQSTQPATRRALRIAALSLSLWMALFAAGCGKHNPAVRKKLIVLGIDGMDPELLRRYMADGKLPHFAALAEQGGLRPLGTTIPPQSPVAWSSLITGMNPGGHGIFDFIHRDPQTLLPYLSTSRVEAPKRTLRLGPWLLPLSEGRITLLRQGTAFWEILDRQGIPATILRMPANFPPVDSGARTLAGMGTPDLLGTYGTFSFYTDDPPAGDGQLRGGRLYPVRREGSRVSAQLTGPYNPFRAGQPPTTMDFRVWLDAAEPVAKLVVQEQVFLLREGEWSDWIPVEFTLIPHLQSVTGICKFYLKQVRPRFQLYVTPLNLDPSRPALPLSTPEGYVRQLWQEAGYFYTQGIAEDTQALSGGVLSDAEYVAQARMVLAEQRRLFALELGRFQAGLLFGYFSSLDQNAHMFWRALDERHPAHTPELAARYSNLLEELYQEMDEVLGEVMQRLDDNTTLLVLSDHGFAPYYRSFNLNTWLLERGYAHLRPDVGREAEFLLAVDWRRTRAYGLGLNALYLNRRGREREGIVEPGPEADALRAELARALLALREPKTGRAVITRVDLAAQAYSGPHASEAPDLLIGYNRGYRAGWGTVLGGFPAQVLEDNREPWSGDHCIDFTLVPGVLLSNRKIRADSPRLTDVAPTILAEFGLEKPETMEGQSVFAPRPPRNR